MAIEDFDCIIGRIDAKLSQVPPLASERCIFKVPSWLRMVNEKVYEPVIVAIGPYHRGKKHLNAMEELKPRYLSSLLQRNTDITVPKIVKSMRMEEEKARNCYAEIVHLDKDDFVEMLVLDGCFVVEFFWGFSYDGDNNSATRIFMDLFLLENQLPFFIIWKLVCIFFPDRDNRLIKPKEAEGTAVPSSSSSSSTKSIFEIFANFVSGPGHVPEHEYASETIERINHLPGLIYDNWLPPPERMEAYKKRTLSSERSFIRCATKLREAGIKFRKVEGGNMFDINFSNGEMKIPAIEVTDGTEFKLRNVIAYEQIYRRSAKFVTDYMIFMDSLINSEKDVELLCRHEIICNCLGDDESVATLFNQLGKNVVCDSNDFYADVVEAVTKHCNKKWNERMANLRHNYFNTPWALISVLAAAVLLLLTLTQTIYSVLSFYN